MSATVAAGTDDLLAPLLAALPHTAVADAHTHLGLDVDGSSLAAGELLARLDALRPGSAAVVFALDDPAGLPAANAAVLDAAAASGGRLTPFVRLDPHDDPLTEFERGVAAGARGVKLHPRAQTFGGLDHPALAEVFARCAQARLPVLVHAGRGIEPLGDGLLALGRRHPELPIVLAHAGISDLAWLPEALDELPGVLFDTSWWVPADLLALFALVPPGRILFASDAPYGDPALNAALTLRCARACGLGSDAIAAVMGGQLARLLAGEPLADLGPAPGPPVAGGDPRLERFGLYVAAAWGMAMAGAPPVEPLQLARQALALPPGHRHAAVAAAAGELLDLPPFGPRGMGGLALAAALAATPQLGL